MKVAIIYNKDISGVINKFGIQNKEFYSLKNVNLVAGCLEKNGHTTAVIDGNMYVIERLQDFMPRAIEGEQMGMVFNMAYGIQGESRYTHLPSMLEMLGVPYVGSTPSGHAVALDKVMTKVVWQNRGLPTPDFWVFNSKDDDLGDVRYPVIVKPKMESVSFGLRVVDTEDDLKDAIHFIVTTFQQQALVEQFIPGREFAVGLLGNSPVEAFPVLELDLEGDPNAIQTETHKKQKPLTKICPANIPEELARKMTEYSKQAFKALGLRDFARVDIRLAQDDTIYLLEINSMASLGQTGSYVHAAKVAGYDFPALVNKILDVAAVRYFSGSLLETLPGEKGKKLPLANRLRTFLRGRQQNTEDLLEKLVNLDTHVRNIEGVNRCTDIIKSHLVALGFTAEVYPQFEVGHLMYLTNTTDLALDYLLLMPVDDTVRMSRHETFSKSEHRLYGTGVWESKGGIVTCISAFQALRFAKLLKKLKIGVFVITDTAITSKFSTNLVSEKAVNAAHVLSLHGSNMEGSIITSRSGSASYAFSLKLVDASCAENVALASRIFFKTLSAIVDLAKGDTENVIAPFNTEFQSNLFKIKAYGSAQISVRFNGLDVFESIDQSIRKLTKMTRKEARIVQTQLDGGLARPPLPANEKNAELFEKIKVLAKRIDTRVVAEHRWSSAHICNIPTEVARLDGFGPQGGFDTHQSEFIRKNSLIERALLLALLLGKR